MPKYHSHNGHLYYYIGDYRAYLSYSVQLKFIYRRTDKSHDVLLRHLDRYVQDYVHGRGGCLSIR
ncbi:hypothetical protein N8920_05575 [Opitutales bacterium]|nr:hypothetical protein [Opitutales bacterium]